MDYVLTTNAVSKKYRKTKALDGVTMHIPRGAIYGFVGRNGAGKTTLIRVICGLQDPSDGDYTLCGINSASGDIASARRKMSAVVEKPAFYSNMTAKQNLEMQYTLLGIPSYDGIDNLLKLVVMEIYIGLGVALLVDLYTGKPYWSVTWVIPMIFTGLTIVIAVMGKALKMPVEEYIMYLLFDVIVSTGLQGILIVCGVNTFRIPALISIAFVIVFFLGMVIFNHRVFGKESKKLFNV